MKAAAPPLPDKMIYAQGEDESLRVLRTALSKLQNSLAEHKHEKALQRLETALAALEHRIRIQEEEYYVLMRRYAELVKQKAIQAPPDQPILQTVPWAVGHPTTLIHNKGELSKRTETSVATIQKKGK